MSESFEFVGSAGSIERARPRLAACGWVASVALLLSGCAGLASPGAFEAATLAPVQQAAVRHLGWPADQPLPNWRDAGSTERAAQRVKALLAEPLTADAAAQVALANQPALQVSFEGLTIAELGGDADRFEQRRRTVAGLLATAAEARRAQIRTIAAAQSLRQSREALALADAGAELARRMVAAGNWPAWQGAQQQAVQSDAVLAVARAELTAARERNRLAQRLGLVDGGAALRLPDRLPELPAALPGEPSGPDDTALAERLDVRAAQALIARLTCDLQNAPPEVAGNELRMLQAQLRRAQHRAAQASLDARAEWHEAEAAWRAKWAIGGHVRDQVVPAAQRQAEEGVLRYNGMLIGVFELLAESRAPLQAMQAAIEAQRDFWLAQVDLEQVRVMPLNPATAVDVGGQP